MEGGLLSHDQWLDYHIQVLHACIHEEYLIYQSSNSVKMKLTIEICPGQSYWMDMGFVTRCHTDES